MSRLRSTLALAVLVALAVALVACGGDSGSKDPKTVIDNATLQGIESGVLDLSLSVDAKGKEGGDVDVSVSGPFQEGGGGKDDLPQLDVIADVNGTFNGREIDFDGGLVLLPSSAYVNYQGVDYEVDPTSYSFLESIVNSQSEEGESTSLTACQETVGELKPANFIDNLQSQGEADVGGTSTTKVSGDLNVSGALDAVIELTEDPACSTQLKAAGPLPSKSEIEDAESEVKSGLKSAQIDVYVGDDDIVRQISAQLKIEPKKGSGDRLRNAQVDFELKLTDVNDEQEIAAPEGAKPLSDLFVKLNVNPLEVLGLLQGEGDLGGLLRKLGGTAGGSDGGGQ